MFRYKNCWWIAPEDRLLPRLKKRKYSLLPGGNFLFSLWLIFYILPVSRKTTPLFFSNCIINPNKKNIPAKKKNLFFLQKYCIIKKTIVFFFLWISAKPNGGNFLLFHTDWRRKWYSGNTSGGKLFPWNWTYFVWNSNTEK